MFLDQHPCWTWNKLQLGLTTIWQKCCCRTNKSCRSHLLLSQSKLQSQLYHNALILTVQDLLRFFISCWKTIVMVTHCSSSDNLAWAASLLHNGPIHLLLIIWGVLKQREISIFPYLNTRHQTLRPGLSLLVIKFSYPHIVPEGKKYKPSINLFLSHTYRWVHCSANQRSSHGFLVVSCSSGQRALNISKCRPKLKINCAILHLRTYLFQSVGSSCGCRRVVKRSWGQRLWGWERRVL